MTTANLQITNRFKFCYLAVGVHGNTMLINLFKVEINPGSTAPSQQGFFVIENLHLKHVCSFLF